MLRMFCSIHMSYNFAQFWSTLYLLGLLLLYITYEYAQDSDLILFESAAAAAAAATPSYSLAV